MRATSRAKSIGRLLLTYRARNLAARRINPWLADYVAATNSATFQHLFVIDETELVRKFGRCALGQYLSTSGFLHSVVLSQRLAREYRLRMVAVGHLMGKKLIVCDLDNTLWEGTIGDGPVTHYLDRQFSLKQLKDHSGVVLSIASKNEPAYVHFRGGALTASDFVAPQISWNQKSNSIANIKSTLNLQTKHMVFLDGRPEERALVRETLPDLLALDPNDPETWELINLWSAMTFGSSDVDRTRLYQDQVLRDAITETPSTDGADSETLKRLSLVISLSLAKRSDLKRVTELVNRTNQWNMCGSRTSFEQVREWHKSSTASIFVANVADRFGDMGLVCIAVVTQQADRVEIPLFVLSCRAFGYGVESAMLAEIARRFEVRPRGKSLIGHYRSTAQNHPCRNMYSDHGFVLKDGVFRCEGSTPIPTVPWAEVRILA